MTKDHLQWNCFTHNSKKAEKELPILGCSLQTALTGVARRVDLTEEESKGVQYIPKRACIEKMWNDCSSKSW